MNPIAFITSAVRRVRERYDAACEKAEREADAAEMECLSLRVTIRQEEVTELLRRRWSRGSAEHDPELEAAIQASRDELFLAEERVMRTQARIRAKRPSEILQRPD